MLFISFLKIKEYQTENDIKKQSTRRGVCSAFYDLFNKTLLLLAFCFKAELCVEYTLSESY